MNPLQRLRRWWKPAESEDDHPLTDKEREERQPLTMQDELGKLGGERFGPPIDPDEELEPPPGD